MAGPHSRWAGFWSLVAFTTGRGLVEAALAPALGPQLFGSCDELGSVVHHRDRRQETGAGYRPPAFRRLRPLDARLGRVHVGAIFCTIQRRLDPGHAHPGRRETLYVAGMRDVLVALNTTDGSERWRLDFVKRFGSDLPTFGFVSSPLVDGDSLYVQAGGGVARLRKSDGQVVWHGVKDGGGMMGSAFGSPVILTLAGKRQLVVQARTQLIGVSLEDGSELWSLPVESFRGMNILTPTFAGKDRLFTATYGGKTLGIDIRSEQGRFRAVPAWEYKAQGYMTSPIIHQGHAYLQLRSQRALCIELATGQEKWTTGESFGKYWSMVAQGDRILALDERGELILFRATPEKFDVLSRRKVSDSDTWAHLAVDGSAVYVRELNGLSAWDWTGGALK